MLKDKQFTKKITTYRTEWPIELFVEEQFYRGGKNTKSSKRRKGRIKPVRVKPTIEEDIRAAMIQDKLDDFGQLNDDHLEYKNGMMYFKNKVYVPQSLRE
jgi:hypothetical protein